MLRLNEFLKPLMERLDLYKPCRDRQALVLWPDIVGPYVRSNTAAVAIKGGILFVRTASTVWMNELQVGFSQKYIADLNSRLGENIVKDIRYLPPPLPTQDEPSQEEGLALQPLQADDERLIEEVVASLDIPELKYRLRRLMRRDRALYRARLAAGWRPCPQCEMLTARGSLCSTCEQQVRRNHVIGVRKMLLRAPWATPLEIKVRFPKLTLKEYELIKGHILRGLKRTLEDWSQHSRPEEMFSEEALGNALRYCMLRFGKRPHELSREDIRVALGTRLFRRYRDN